MLIGVQKRLQQNGDPARKAAENIAKLSAYVYLAPGDLIFTGRPAGISTIVRSDLPEGAIEGGGPYALRLSKA